MSVTTLIDLFRSLEKRRGEFLVYDDGYRVRRHSYADVTRAARGFAAGLIAHGVVKGDKVVLWGENRPEWIACYWGIQLAGAIAVPIDYRSSRNLPNVSAGLSTRESSSLGDDDRVADSQGRRRPEAQTNLADGRSRLVGDGPVPDIPIDRDDIAQIVFTSGATAEPKGVVIRHRNILANTVPVAKEIDKYKKYARPFSPIRFLNLLPLSHMFGQSMATNIPPLIDGTVVFMRSFNPHDIVRRVREWRISVIVCVPKILDVLKEHALRIDPAAADPPTGLSIPARWWRYRKIHRMFGMKFWAFIVGAAPLGSALEDYWKRLGFVVIQGYGLTETAPIVTMNHPFKTNTGSVGKPIAGVEVKIADGRRDSRARRERDDGVLRSRDQGSGDQGSGRHGRTIDEDGWLHTGDIGEKDAEGRLFIRGRKKEMIVTPEGLNVFPDDVERPLNAQTGRDRVRRGRTRAADGAEAPRRVHAVLRARSRNRCETIVRDANAQLADHQRIRSFSIWTDGPLPRTEGTKKLKRAAIKAGSQSGAQPASACAGVDPLAGAAGEVRGRAGARRRHVDRRARAELARARRVDGGARRSVPDAHRRNEVRRREDARRSARGDRGGAAGSRGRRAGGLPVVEPRVAGADHPARQPGDVDPAARAASSRGCASAASSTSRA